MGNWLLDKEFRNMKKSIKLIVICILLIHNYSAVLAQNKFEGGPIIGFGVSSFHGSNNQDFSLHDHIGFLLNYKFKDKLILQTSVLHSTKGYTHDLLFPYEKVKLRYIDLIENFIYQPAKTFYIGGGIYTGWLYRSKYRHLVYSDYFYDSNISGIVHKFDFGLNGSIGIQFENGIEFEISFLYGLQNVFKASSSNALYNGNGITYGIPPEAKGKNTVISTSFCYLFGSKH